LDQCLRLTGSDSARQTAGITPRVLLARSPAVVVSFILAHLRGMCRKKWVCHLLLLSDGVWVKSISRFGIVETRRLACSSSDLPSRRFGYARMFIVTLSLAPLSSP
jgi:hypothetical protein